MPHDCVKTLLQIIMQEVKNSIISMSYKFSNVAQASKFCTDQILGLKKTPKLCEKDHYRTLLCSRT